MQSRKAPDAARHTVGKTKNKKETQSCPEYNPGASGELVKVNIIEARQ